MLNVNLEVDVNNVWVLPSFIVHWILPIDPCEEFLLQSRVELLLYIEGIEYISGRGCSQVPECGGLHGGVLVPAQEDLALSDILFNFFIFFFAWDKFLFECILVRDGKEFVIIALSVFIVASSSILVCRPFLTLQLKSNIPIITCFLFFKNLPRIC